MTVIFGRNNTGKSSILQSLLLLRQTLDSPEYGARLNLRGPLYPAGSYADIVHQHESKQRILMTFGVDLREGRQGEAEFEFSSDEPQPPRLTSLKVRGQDIESLEFRRGRGAGGPFELWFDNQQIGGEKYANFLFPVSRFLPLIGPEPVRRGRPSSKRHESRRFARDVLEQLAVVLLSMRAVGAFRHQPERRYEYQGRLRGLVDATGVNVVNALFEDLTRRGRRRGELFRNVNRWLKSVGRVRLLPLRRISKSARIFEVRLKDIDSGRWANFADVGFGIGQAFPVFVEGLRTPEGGMFLVQEPEIHLHPDAQLAMADFLVSLARRGRRVVAETHSEHVLLRIRHSIVRTLSNGSVLRPDEVSIVYVDKSADGTSRARKLEIDELGQIRKWPTGFMEEATHERMAIMREMAARAKAGQ
ncbi:MAG: AAA family ATPase [Planctomycetes bacterium]|nr:AAA family ATPase [Planctomycetota bacterium]